LHDVLCANRACVSVTVHIVAPPFPCAGTGVLRVVRASRADDRMALDAAYEGYVRL
jgi:hypothetical protein